MIKFTQQELTDLIKFRDVDGLSYKEIALKMNRLKSDGTPNDRFVMDAYLKFKKAPLVDKPKISVSLEEMNRRQRFDFLQERIKTDPRAQLTFNKILSADEKEVFLKEYFQILSEQDSLTNAEELQLFTAILNLVLFYRAQERDSTSYNNFVNKVPGPTGMISVYDSRWATEAKECYKQYETGIKLLKISRQQRLEDIQKAGNTFLDYADIMTKRESQESIMEDILKIEKMAEDELAKLIANGWLLSGKLNNNNPEVNYGQDVTKTTDN